MSHTPPQPDRDAVSPEEIDAYDRVVRRQNEYDYAAFHASYPHGPQFENTGGKVQPFFAALLNSPTIADHVSELGVFYRTRGEVEGSYAHADREWVDMVLAVELHWNRVLYSHMMDAVAVGVRPEAIKALRDGRDEDLTERERQLAQYIRAVARGSVTAEQYHSVEGLLGRRATVELTAFTGHLIMIIRVMQAFGDFTRTDQQVDELLAGILDGTQELPDPKARIPALELR